MGIMLTKKQHELLTYIHERLTANGFSPSFDEMKEALGLRSKSGVHRLITALTERGFIRRLPHRARALEVLKLPETADSPGGFSPSVIEGRFDSALNGRSADQAGETIGLPLYGRIAAGTPIAALADQSTSVEVPAGLIGKGDHYALEVAGDSMVEAGILDGDTVIIHQCDAAESGTIVVAFVDDSEVTLKRLRRKGGSIALEPANRGYETRIVPADRVKVQGRLVGLIRKY